MTIKSLPKINPNTVFQLENICTFYCMPILRNPNDKTHIYVNHNGKIEKFDNKKATGKEEEQSWNRINNFVEKYLLDYGIEYVYIKTFLENMPRIHKQENPNYI